MSGAEEDPAKAEDNGPKTHSAFKMVDGNGLALMCFGFSTFMFFAFNANVDHIGFATTGPDQHFGVHALCPMLTWGVSLGLVVAGVAQGLQGDDLGFTSYIFHAAVLGTVGYNFEDLLYRGPGGASTYMLSWLLYAAFYVNLVFTVMAFSAALVFGILYFSVAVMFLVVGLNFSQKLDGSQDDASDVTGGRIAAAFCLWVAFQCFVLLIPVMTGFCGFLFTLPNPCANLKGKKDPPPDDGSIKPQTMVKLCDANGLALICFGFSTFQFFVFKENIDGVNWGDNGNGNAKKDAHQGVQMLSGMLTWGVGMGLTVSGIFQFFNGDHLGFTSYIFHAAILGTTGYWIDDLVKSGGAFTTHIFSYFYYAAFFFNVLFTIMAFRLAKMFGVLYATVALMFLIVGLDWSGHFDRDGDVQKTTHVGSYLSGFVCIAVASQCFYLLWPVLCNRLPIM